MRWQMLVPLGVDSEVLTLVPQALPAEGSGPACRRIVRISSEGPDGAWRACAQARGGEPEPLADPGSLFDAASGPSFDVVVWTGNLRGDRAVAGLPAWWPGLEEAARAVRAGGYLVFPLVSPLWGAWNPCRPLLARMAERGGNPRSMLVDLDPPAPRAPRGSQLRCRARLLRLGFDTVRFFQWFPNHRVARFAVPLDHAGAVDYFLSHLLPRKSRRVASVLGAARVANRLGLYRTLLPLCGVLARKGGSDLARRDS